MEKIFKSESKEQYTWDNILKFTNKYHEYSISGTCSLCPSDEMKRFIPKDRMFIDHKDKQ